MVIAYYIFKMQVKAVFSISITNKLKALLLVVWQPFNHPHPAVSCA